MRFALLDDNLRVTDLMPLQPGMGGSAQLYLADDSVQLGWAFDPATRQFASPGRRRWITRRSFRNRFTNTETVRIERTLADLVRADATDAQRNIAAQVSAFQRSVSDGPYVDLDLPETIAGLNWMWFVAGILDSHDRIAQFLEGPIEPSEYAPEA